MNWKQAIEKANKLNNFPKNMINSERKLYKKWQAEIMFNEHHNINEGHTENLRNSCHRLISRYIDGKAQNKIDCSIRKKLQNMYLDFKNNYLTISHFAENNNLDCYRAVKILKHGYAVHEKQFERR